MSHFLLLHVVFYTAYDDGQNVPPSKPASRIRTSSTSDETSYMWCIFHSTRQRAFPSKLLPGGLWMQYCNELYIKRSTSLLGPNFLLDTDGKPLTNSLGTSRKASSAFPSPWRQQASLIATIISHIPCPATASKLKADFRISVNVMNIFNNVASTATCARTITIELQLFTNLWPVYLLQYPGRS